MTVVQISSAYRRYESALPSNPNQEPRRYREGINHVFVNGIEVARDGRHTAARPGCALRRA